jgi:hypothetical protein
MIYRVVHIGPARNSAYLGDQLSDWIGESGVVVLWGVTRAPGAIIKPLRHMCRWRLVIGKLTNPRALRD